MAVLAAAGLPRARCSCARGAARASSCSLGEEPHRWGCRRGAAPLGLSASELWKDNGINGDMRGEVGELRKRLSRITAEELDA